MPITVRLVEAADEPRFVAAARASRRLHHPWVAAPADAAAFAAYLARMNRATDYGFVAETAAVGDLVGVVNLTNVVRGTFQSGYLGYYAFAGHERRGLMKQALLQVVRHAFGTLGLHRLEANIQPANVASIGLVRACGFSREGYSPKYLKIAGRWRDHERWALVKGAKRSGQPPQEHTHGRAHRSPR
jgi:ribosomal-protein-alanine N-acetyltransferase